MPMHNLFPLLRRPRSDQTPSAGCGDAPPSTWVPEQKAAPWTLDRLDLQAAELLHLEWCVQLNEYLCQLDQAVTPLRRTLPEIDQSGLGLWLQRSASRAPGQHPLFEALLCEHRRLHERAEAALKLAAEHRMDLASAVLNTDFEHSRAKVLSLLREMQKS